MTSLTARPIETPDMSTSLVMPLPKLGFVGTGWIGRLRMETLMKANIAEFSAVYDPSPEAAKAAAAMKANISISEDFEELLDTDVDGLVIATPSAFHADHCVAALERGKAVFCQKPLARTCVETQRVVDAARLANKLLSVDFSYRHLAGMDKALELITGGELGEIYAADLVFHNAYGPDKPWFYNVSSAGGGCIMDLGTHLVDLAMWLLGNDNAKQVSSDLFHHGKKLRPPYQTVEDYAVANFMLGHTQTRLCCSWNLHAGREAVIEAHFYGTQGGISITNVNGSFYNFEIHHLTRTSRHKIAGYPDEWGGRALIAWARRLGFDSTFDHDIKQVIQVADVIDRIYCR